MILSLLIGLLLGSIFGVLLGKSLFLKECPQNTDDGKESIYSQYDYTQFVINAEKNITIEVTNSKMETKTYNVVTTSKYIKEALDEIAGDFVCVEGVQEKILDEKDQLEAVLPEVVKMKKDFKEHKEQIEALEKTGNLLTSSVFTELKTSNNGKLGEMLTDLIYCDFLQKNNVREKRIKSNSAIYQLIDFYTIFYNTFANKNIMEEHFWTRNINTPEINIWYGLAFKRVHFIFAMLGKGRR